MNSYFWDDYGGLIMGVVAVIILILGIIFLVEKSEQRDLEMLKNAGYNAREVQLFCKTIGIDADDFLCSKGMQIQYEKFSEGETTEYMQQAKANKKSNDAKNTATSNGFIAGYVGGMCASAGRR